VQLELTNKLPEIDHKDFDFQYQINKNRNEAKLTEELKALRESRKELRDFEKNIDKDLPSLKKLKDFRETAKDVIDGKRSFKGALLQRTQREEQDLMDKIRQLQKDNPDKDYTQLFQTERAELLRK
jgi:GTP1/Obg family GTP-binding protein